MLKALLIGFMAFLFFVGSGAAITIAREFEHDIDNSVIERPEQKPKTEYHSMIATAYCLTGSTATGSTPRAGIAASKPEWFGKTVKVYWNDGGKPGTLIGTYTIEDTGGDPIRKGHVIDIWLPTDDECFQFGRRCVLVEVL